MNLDNESIKKLRQLILFTIVILIALWNYAIIFKWIGFAFGIIFPFLLGGGIAFVINVPMNFLEEKIFRNRYLKDKKVAKRLARPVSLVLTIGIVVGVIVLVMFVVIPELTKTVISLGRTIRVYIPEVQRFWDQFFIDNKEVSAWLDSLNLNVDRLLDNAVAFFQNGAGDVLNSTMSAIGSIVSGVTTFVIAFVFGCYVLLQKEKLRVQIQKVMYAFMPEERVEWCLEVCSLTAKSFSSFLTGQCVEALILGMMFFITMSIFNMPYALLVAVLIAFTALNSDIRGFYRMFYRSLSDIDGGPSSGTVFCHHVPYLTADRRKSDLPEGGGGFRRASVYLGAGGGYAWRQSDGNRRNAYIYSQLYQWCIRFFGRASINVLRESTEI